MRLKVATDSVDFGSNINDVIVPEEMKKKFLSGLDFFDASIGGAGFTPSASMIFTGEAGAGKTTMMLTLADNLTKSGAIAVFNTAEESLFQVKAVCERLGLKKGFAVGNETNVADLLKKADKLRAQPQNDGHVHLGLEKKDKELMGLRKLETTKNRFGGAGATTWMSLSKVGFEVVAVAEEE